MSAWCLRTCNELIEVRDQRARVRRGRRRDPLTELAPEQLPGTRLWMYTNFDCKLACDYCVRPVLPADRPPSPGGGPDPQLVSKAVDAGVSELILTGGEPFLLPDLVELVATCTAVLPTTGPTACCLHGRRLGRLRRMDRSRLALRISLDSATPALHDSHRGAGSWQRAVAGIRTAQSEGFRVRVAATLPPEQASELGPFHAFLDSRGTAVEDQVIRALAHRGVADSGLELTVESLLPEVTITAEGVYWHPGCR